MVGVIRSAVAAAIGPALLVLGWGIGDLDDFGDEPARVVATVVVAVGLPFVATVFRYRANVSEEIRTQLVVPVITVAGAAALFAGAAALDATLSDDAWLRVPDSVRWAAIPVLATGMGLQAWSVHTLGRFFTIRVATHDDHELVVAGPYRRVRHPSYTGLLVWLAALPAAFGTAAGVLAVVVALPMAIRRMSREEELLMARFGDEYREYKASTHRLAPGVY